MDFNISNSPYIKQAVDKLVKSYRPEKIYLFSQKSDLDGEITSFKLCLVVDTNDRQEIEKHIYREIDLDIPFDILIYTPEEWEKITHRTASFASRIMENGVLLYGEA